MTKKAITTAIVFMVSVSSLAPMAMADEHQRYNHRNGHHRDWDYHDRNRDYHHHRHHHHKIDAGDVLLGAAVGGIIGAAVSN